MKDTVQKMKRQATRLTDLENIISGEKEGGRGNIGVGRKTVFMGLYEIMCV